MSLSQGVPLEEWKAAVERPLHRCGPITEIKSFRSIFVLLTHTKILKCIAHRQLLKYLEVYPLLVKHKFGFRQKMSTELAETFLTGYIRKQEVVAT